MADADGFFSLAMPLEEGVQDVTLIAETPGNRSKPALFRVVRTTRPATPQNLVDLGTGDEVALQWDANGEPGLLGYRVFENDAATPPPVAVTIAATDAGNPVPGVSDGNPGTFWASGAGDQLEIDLGGERLVRSITLRWRVSTVGGEEIVRTADVYRLGARHGPGWVVLHRSDGDLQASPVLELADAYRTDRLRLVVEAERQIEGAAQPAQLVEVEVLEAPITTASASYDATPSPGFYSYRVSAVDDYGLESPRSAATPEREIGDVTPPPAPQLTASLDGFDGVLSWTASLDADVYEVERNGAVVNSTGALDWRDVALPDGTHRYQVFALDLIGNRSEGSNAVEVTVSRPAPGAPVIFDFFAFGDVTSGSVFIEWLSGQGPAPSAYGVWRSARAGGPYEELARIPGTLYFDIFEDTPPPAPVLYYVIVAYGEGGAVSAPSAEQIARFGDDPGGGPVLFYPVPSGRDFRAFGDTSTVAGLAPAGGEIELLRDGQLVAVTDARSSTRAESVSASCPGTVVKPWPSWDGRYLWIDCGDRHQLV
ncbi:MAG: hypothetical protein AAFX50_13780, partial [Acidobacteriota bacterium]